MFYKSKMQKSNSTRFPSIVPFNFNRLAYVLPVIQQLFKKSQILFSIRMLDFCPEGAHTYTFNVSKLKKQIRPNFKLILLFNFNRLVYVLALIG